MQHVSYKVFCKSVSWHDA